MPGSPSYSGEYNGAQSGGDMNLATTVAHYHATQFGERTYYVRDAQNNIIYVGTDYSKASDICRDNPGAVIQ